MGEVSGQVARAWHRRRRDQRLGYSALGLAAGGFVLVLVGTLLVTEVVPGLLDDDPPAQQVEPSSQLEPDGSRSEQDTTVPVRLVADDAPAAAPLPEQPASPGPSVPQPQPQPAPQPEPQPQPGPQPQPQPQPGQGPVGTVLDPVVAGVAGTADGLTGGATAPVTAPVVDVVDGVTDVVDGLLSGR